MLASRAAGCKCHWGWAVIAALLRYGRLSCGQLGSPLQLSVRLSSPVCHTQVINNCAMGGSLVAGILTGDAALIGKVGADNKRAGAGSSGGSGRVNAGGVEGASGGLLASPCQTGVRMQLLVTHMPHSTTHHPL